MTELSPASVMLPVTSARSVVVAVELISSAVVPPPVAFRVAVRLVAFCWMSSPSTPTVTLFVSRSKVPPFKTALDLRAL